ncbi:hypothetical protein ACFQV4_28630 [Streptomyces thermocarboxydus]
MIPGLGPAPGHGSRATPARWSWSPDATGTPATRRPCCTGTPAASWQAGPAWPARNALRGWTDDHWAGDLRSPIGVYSLSDSGGLLPDPGTRLPYDRSDGFAVSGTGFEGEPLEVLRLRRRHRLQPRTRRLPWT